MTGSPLNSHFSAKNNEDGCRISRLIVTLPFVLRYKDPVCLTLEIAQQQQKVDRLKCFVLGIHIFVFVLFGLAFFFFFFFLNKG